MSTGIFANNYAFQIVRLVMGRGILHIWRCLYILLIFYSGWIKDLRRLIEIMKNTAAEQAAAVKSGAERCPSSRKLIAHMVNVVQCIQNPFAFWKLNYRRNSLFWEETK